MPMTRKKLAERVAERLDLDPAIARETVRETFALIEESVRLGDEVRIYGFGRFQRVQGRTRYYDFKRAETVEVAPKERAEFFAGRRMIFNGATPALPEAASDQQGD